MRLLFRLICIVLYSSSVMAQKVSETTAGIGFNQLGIPNFGQHWDDEGSPPIFLNLSTSHSWYRTDRRLSVNKEIGVNLQYSDIELSSGGLGAHNYGKWKMLNLFAEAALQARIQLDSTFAIGFGPVGEYLISGYQDEKVSYYSMVSTPPSSGDIHHSGMRRDYFSNPLYGIKLSIFNSLLNERTTLRLNVSYLWTKSDITNFYGSGLLKISAAIGIKHRKKPQHLQDQ